MPKTHMKIEKIPLFARMLSRLSQPELPILLGEFRENGDWTGYISALIEIKDLHLPFEGICGVLGQLENSPAYLFVLADALVKGHIEEFQATSIQIDTDAWREAVADDFDCHVRLSLDPKEGAQILIITTHASIIASSFQDVLKAVAEEGDKL